MFCNLGVKKIEKHQYLIFLLLVKVYIIVVIFGV